MNSKDLTAQLQKLLDFRPVTANQEQTNALLEYVAKELDTVGLRTQLSVSNGFTSLVAGTRSLKRSKLLLQAHIDVVPATDEVFAIRQVAGRLLGRGTCDMMFAAAIYLCLMRTLKAEGTLAHLDLGLMLTSDEEIGGHDGVGRLMNTYDCEVCLLPDAGGPTDINVQAKGVMQLGITFAGASGHAGRPYDYDNPIPKASAFVQSVVEAFPNDNIAKTVCSISMIDAGTAANQVPATAKVTLDIRYIAADDPQQLKAQLEKLAAAQDGTVRVLALDPGYDIDISDPHIQRFLSIYEKTTGLTAKPMSVPGSSDARFIAAKGIPVIMMRPEAGGMHADTEYLDIASFANFAKVIKKYVLTEAKV